MTPETITQPQLDAGNARDLRRYAFALADLDPAGLAVPMAPPVVSAPAAAHAQP